MEFLTHHDPELVDSENDELEEEHATKRPRKAKHATHTLRLDIKPIHFQGTPDENVKYWIRDFQEIMRGQNISTSDQRRILPIFLQGTAKEWFYNQADEDIRTIEQVLNKLQCDFQPTDAPTQLAEQFFNRQQTPHESVMAYANALQTLARQTAQTNDTTLRAKFISGLQQEIKFHVQIANPTTFAEALRIASNYEAAKQHTDSGAVMAVIDTVTEPNGNTNDAIQTELHELKRMATELEKAVDYLKEREQWRNDKRRAQREEYRRDKRFQQRRGKRQGRRFYNDRDRRYPPDWRYQQPPNEYDQWHPPNNYHQQSPHFHI